MPPAPGASAGTGSRRAIRWPRYCSRSRRRSTRPGPPDHLGQQRRRDRARPVSASTGTPGAAMENTIVRRRTGGGELSADIQRVVEVQRGSVVDSQRSLCQTSMFVFRQDRSTLRRTRPARGSGPSVVAGLPASRRTRTSPAGSRRRGSGRRCGSAVPGSRSPAPDLPIAGSSWISFSSGTRRPSGGTARRRSPRRPAPSGPARRRGT